MLATLSSLVDAMAKQNQTTHSQHLNESHTFSIHFVIFFLLTLCCCFYSFVIFLRYLQTIGTFQTTSKIEKIACRFNNCFNSFYLLLFLSRLFFFILGTPINRLPIMAKSVLDLYELYNLVIARGGLVDVINKKLWQEIIKGLHLPSSITSAAFTLRTQ